jgi:hypothetical protein
MEKIYFASCTVSATSGLLRTAAGDQAFHAGIYIRVAMLVSAVLVGLLIVRRHSVIFDQGSPTAGTATIDRAVEQKSTAFPG